MKKQIIVAVAAVGLVVVCSLWLLNRRERQQPTPIQMTPPSANVVAKTAAEKPSVASTPSSEALASVPQPEQRETITPRVSAPTTATDDRNAPVAEVVKVLKELKGIYGNAGSLNWDEAKALLAKRKEAAQELLDRLAKLGPGGARAIEEGYAQADSTRAKLLLIQALGKIGDAEAVGVLQTLLEGADSLSLREEIVLALGRRTETAAEQALTAVLTSGTNESLRFVSAQALSGRESALSALAQRVRLDPSPEVRRELMHCIGRIGNTEAMEALTGIVRASGDVDDRKTAIQELGRSFGQKALGALDQLLNDSDEAIRVSAVKAVARVKTDAATALLQRAATTDASPAVRATAVAMLPKPPSP